MRRPPLTLAALSLLAACASAPEPEPEPAPMTEEVRGLTELYAAPIEDAANTLLTAEPAGAVPAGIQAVIQSIEETATGLFYTAELVRPGRRRRGQDYLIYGQCPADDLDACASQIVTAARMLARPD